jgi:8-oxo-dGTP pyrophosphatase MutT (NUDIX family)
MSDVRHLEPSDGSATRFPVSVKGVLTIDGKIVLLKNERDEWELPGGKLEANEDPESCLIREIEEELGLEMLLLGRIDDMALPVLVDADHRRHLAKSNLLTTI